jgi:GAF domain-containing protein
VGRVCVAYREDYSFSDQESALLGDIGRRLSGYIDSQRLLGETREAAHESAVLYELGQALSAQLEMDQVLDEIYRSVCRLLDAPNFYIGLYDADPSRVVFPLNVTESVVDKEIQVIEADQGLTGYVLRTGESLLIEEDVEGWMRAHAIDAVGEAAQCWLGVPVVIGDRVQGILAVQSYGASRAYSASDRDRLMAIASQAGIAIENARLFEDVQTRARREQALRQIAAQVRNASDEDAVLRTAARELGAALGRRVFARMGSAKELGRPGGGDSGETGPFSVGYVCDLLGVHPVAGLWTPEVADAVIHRLPTPSPTDAPDVINNAEALVAPLLVQGEPVGVVGIYQDPGRGSTSQDPERVFTSQDVDFLESVADQVAQALESVRLARQTSEALAEAQVLSQLAELVSAETDLDAVCSSVARAVVDRMGYAHCQVFIQDEDMVTLQQVGIATRAPDEREIPVASGRDIAQAVLNKGEIVVVNDVQESDLYIGAADDVQSDGRWAAVPLADDEGVMGAICASRPVEEHAITERDSRLLEAIGLQTTNAIQRARLLQRTQTALAAADAATRRYIRDAWEDVVGGGQLEQQAYVAGPEGIAGAGDVMLSEMENALQRGESVSVVTEAEERGGGVFPKRSALAVPLRARGQVIGVVDFFREEEAGEWTERERELVEALVEEIGESLESERQFQQTQITLAETERMYRASQLISGAQSSAEIVKILSDTAFETGADQVAVFVFDRPVSGGTPQAQELVAFQDRSSADPPMPVGTMCLVEDYPLTQTIERNRSLTIPDLARDEQLDASVREKLVQEGFRALAVTPLSVGLEWIGYTVVLRRMAHPFTVGEMRVLNSVGDQAATALRSVRLYMEAQNRARREELIREITSKMRGTPDLDTILSTAVEELGRALGVSRAFVRLSIGTGGEAENGEDKADLTDGARQQVS